MDRPTIEQLAHDTVLKILQKGLAQGHSDSAWKDEPATMHIQKAARHAITASLLLEHPDYTKDAETALEHAENALCRLAMAVWCVNSVLQ